MSHFVLPQNILKQYFYISMPCYISHFDQTATCDVIASWVQEGASTQVIVDNMMQIVMTMATMMDEDYMK